MATKRTLKITIAPNGAVQVEVEGVSGASCTDATKFLEDALGMVVARDLKSDYYAPEVMETETEKVSGAA